MPDIVRGYIRFKKRHQLMRVNGNIKGENTENAVFDAVNHVIGFDEAQKFIPENHIGARKRDHVLNGFGDFGARIDIDGVKREGREVFLIEGGIFFVQRFKTFNPRQVNHFIWSILVLGQHSIGGKHNVCIIKEKYKTNNR